MQNTNIKAEIIEKYKPHQRRGDVILIARKITGKDNTRTQRNDPFLHQVTQLVSAFLRDSRPAIAYQDAILVELALLTKQRTAMAEQLKQLAAA